MKKMRTRLSLRPLEAREAPAIDLVMVDVTSSAPETVVPGQQVTMKVLVRNLGNENATSANSRVRIFASADRTAFYQSDPFIGEGFGLDVPAGKTVTKTVTVTFPDLGGTGPNLGTAQNPTFGPPLNAGIYYVIAFVDAPLVERVNGFYSEIANSDAFPIETKGLNNVGFSDRRFRFGNKFGQVEAGKPPVTLTLRSGDGDKVKTVFSITGPGTGELKINGSTIDLELTGTDKTTVVKAVTSGGSVTRAIRNVTVPDNKAVGTLDMQATDVTGELVFPGGLKSLFLRKLGGLPGSRVDISSGLNLPADITIRQVTNADISARGGIDRFATHEWVDDDANIDVLSAPYIKTLATAPLPAAGLTGDFGANVTVTGISGYGLETVNIGGIVKQSDWSVGVGITTNVKNLTVKQAEDWRLIVTGQVEKLTVKGKYTNADTDVTAAEALWFGDFIVEGDISAGFIRATGADSFDRAFTNLKFGQVETLKEIDARGGGIVRLEAKDWDTFAGATEVRAKWIESVSLTGKRSNGAGDFNAILTLSGVKPNSQSATNPTGTSLRQVTVPGLMTGNGTWTAPGLVNLITVGFLSSFKLTGPAGGPLPRLGTIQTTLGSAVIDIRAASVDSVFIKGDLIGELQVDGAINFVTASGMLNFILIAPGGIKFVKLNGSWSGGSLTAGFVTGIKVGKPVDPLLPSLSNVNVSLNNAAGVTNFFEVAGRMENVNIVTANTYTLKRLTAGAWGGGRLEGGPVGTIELGQPGYSGSLTNVQFRMHGNAAGYSLRELFVDGAIAISDLGFDQSVGRVVVGTMLNSVFTTAKNIDGFTVAADKSLVDVQFNQSTIRAQAIGVVVLREVDQTSSPAYGIFAVSVRNFRRYTGKQFVQLPPLTGDGMDNVEDEAGNFRLTIK